ncbi:MAG: hypothetical protein RLZZ330_419 [Actinomycetota bacterium]|jgi:hypothetical protein
MNAKPNIYPAKSPYCDHELDASKAVDGWVTCECGRRSDARWVNELGWLQSRASWVSDRIRNSEPWFDSNKQSSAQPVEHNRASGQQLLYILGGISLVVAVAVFTAVAWERIGAYGQLAALMVVVAIAAVIAIKTRDGLVGLSNTSAVLAVFVAGTGLLSAPEFGLIDKTYGYSSNIYTTLVFLVLVLAAFAGGYLTKVTSWSLISIVGLVPLTLAFNEGFAQSNYTMDSNHLVSLVTVTAACLASGLMFVAIKNRHEISAIFRVIVTIVECILLFNIFSHSMDTLGHAQTPAVVASGFLIMALIWTFISSRFIASEPGFNGNAIQTSAGYVASGIYGFAIAIALLPAFVPYEYDVWEQTAGSPDKLVVVSALLGAALMLAPLVEQVQNRIAARYLTLTASVFWFAMMNGTGQFNWEKSVDLKTVALFFAVVSVSLAIRWWFVINPAFFIPSVFTGIVAVGILAGETFMKNASGPEPLTISIAIYLFAILQVLRVHTKDPHNSFILIGIPLSVALIPSALVSIRLLAESNSSSSDWARLWIVVAVSVGAVAFGLKLQKSGLLIPGAVAFVFAAIPQIFIRLSVFVPRWIIFGVVGILLITVAARFEHLQKFGRDTRSWFRKLD